MRGTANFFNYVARVGDVVVHRESLSQFARDLSVRPRDFASLVERMAAIGQVAFDRDVLRFCADNHPRVGGDTCLR